MVLITISFNSIKNIYLNHNPLEYINTVSMNHMNKFLEEKYERDAYHNRCF